MTKYYSIKTLFLMLATAALFMACSKDDDAPAEINNSNNSAPVVPSFTLENTSYNQLEFGMIQVGNLNLNATTYSATIASENVSISNIDGDLFFMVPDISPGNYNIVGSVEGNSFDLALTINATPTVASPETYVNDIKKETFDFLSLDSSITEIQNIDSTINLSDHRQALQEIQSDFNNTFNQLNAAQKSELARFLKANETVFNDVGSVVSVDSLNFNKAGLGDLGAYVDAISRNMMKKAIKIATLTAIGVSQLTACTASAGLLFPACAASLVSGGLAIKYSVELLEDYTESLDKTLLLYETDIDGIFEKSFAFKHDKTFRLKIKAHRRTIYKADVGSSNSIIALFINVGNKGVEYYNGIVDFVNDLASEFGKNYDILNRFPHPNDINNFKSKWLNEKGTYYSIEGITNNKVSIKSQRVLNDQLEVVFKNSDTTLQNFGFTLKFDDGDFSHSQRFTASIEGAPELLPSIAGLWTLNREFNGDSVIYVGDWSYSGFSQIVSGNCSGTKIFNNRTKTDLGTLNFTASNSNVRSLSRITLEDRTHSVSPNCDVTYGPWMNSRTETETDDFTYELLSATQLKLSLFDNGQQFIDTFQIVLNNNSLELKSNEDNWVAYYTR